MKNRILASTLFAIILTANLVTYPLSHAHGEETKDPDRKSYEVTTDVNVLGNYLKLNEETNNYDLIVQWPIYNMTQWTSTLDGIEKSPKSEVLYNPVLEKDPSVIIFTQNNPDQISGEDIFISDKGNILQIRRIARDVYFANSANFYNFLVDEIERNKASYSGDNSNLPVYSTGITVVYRGNTTLSNPTWQVQNEAVIELYTNFISEMVKNSRRLGSNKFDVPEKNIFDQLDSFMLYLNYPGAPGRLLVVSKQGQSRLTNIELRAQSHFDKEKYFNKFLTQALAAKKLKDENDEKKKQAKQLENF